MSVTTAWGLEEFELRMEFQFGAPHDPNDDAFDSDDTTFWARTVATLKRSRKTDQAISFPAIGGPVVGPSIVGVAGSITFGGSAFAIQDGGTYPHDETGTLFVEHQVLSRATAWEERNLAPTAFATDSSTGWKLIEARAVLHALPRWDDLAAGGSFSASKTTTWARKLQIWSRTRTSTTDHPDVSDLHDLTAVSAPKVMLNGSETGIGGIWNMTRRSWLLPEGAKRYRIVEEYTRIEKPAEVEFAP